MANSLNFVGRFTEAIELWGQVLERDEEFGMALANKGQAYYWYARYARPEDEQLLMLRESRRLLALAITSGIEEHALGSIAGLFRHVSSMLEETNNVQLEMRTYRADIDEQEKEYRVWCRRHGLFLSHLSDLPGTGGIEDVRDPLVIPSIVLPAAEAGPNLPAVYSMFNQIKQEYTSARYMIYEAVREREQGLHFADRDVLLYDSFDYRIHRLWVERMKASFLSAHAILDKLAYLMNWYWKLGLKPKEVSFSGVWYSKGRKERGIAPPIERARQNLPLRGLFWLSKDFHEKPEEDQLAPEPRMLHEIRNHIAHKYLRVHDHLVSHLPADRAELPSDFSFQITDDELQRYTLKLMRVVRSAVIYLVAAVLHEEADKKAQVDDALIASMPVRAVNDDYRL